MPRPVGHGGHEPTHGFVYLAASLAALLSGLFVLLGGGTDAIGGLPLDDAWIHQVYGRAVAAGGILAFNDGTPSSGATSPLWAYLLGVVHAMGPDLATVLAMTRGLGLVLHALAAVLAARVVLQTSGSRVAAAVVGGMLGACPPLATAAVSGMEVPLASALLVGALDRHLAGRAVATGVLLGLAGLARPELGLAGLLFLLDGARRALRGNGPWKDVARMLLPMAVMGAAFVGWNLLATGRPLTATFYRKVNTGEIMPLIDRWITGAGMLLAEPPLLPSTIALAVMAAISVRARVPRGTGLALAVGVAHVVASVTVVAPLDSESFYFLRYLLPAVPLLWIGCALPVAAWAVGARRGRDETASRRVEEGPSGSRVAVVPGLSRRVPLRLPAIVAFVFVAFTGGLALIGLPAWAVRHATWCRNIDDVQVRLGRLIDERFPADAVIGTTDAGAVRYLGRRHTVDLMGLNTPRPGDDGVAGPRLDAVVFMPAWLGVQRSDRLELLAQAKAEGYAISTNSSFALQVMIGCRTREGDSTLDLPAAILGTPVTLPMRCHDDATLERLAWIRP